MGILKRDNETWKEALTELRYILIGVFVVTPIAFIHNFTGEILDRLGA